MTTMHDHVETGLDPGDGQPGPWGGSDPVELDTGAPPDPDPQVDDREDGEAAPRSVGELVAARRGDRNAPDTGPRPHDEGDNPGHRDAEPTQGGYGPGPSVHERMRAAVIAAAGEIRWVSERPASLRDQIGYARHGAWTAEIDGRARHLQLIWAWVVAIPVTVVAYLAVWSVSRSPLRALAVWGVVAVVATVFNQVPGVGLLVPDWASLTAWPPFSWL